jgi:hypothetical protein
LLAPVDDAPQLLAATLPDGLPRAETQKRLQAVRAKEAKAALPKMAEFAAKYPAFAARPKYQLTRVTIHLAAGDFLAAGVIADRLLALENPLLLGELVNRWTNPGLNDTRYEPRLAVRAAERILAFDLPGPAKHSRVERSIRADVAAVE